MGKDLESQQLSETFEGCLCHRVQFKSEHGVWEAMYVTLR